MRHSDAKTAFLNDMRGSREGVAQISMHLGWLRSQGDEGAKAADTLTADVIEVFTSESGLRVLKLLEKSVLFASLPNGASDGALREWNAVRNFVLDLRRIVSNG